MNKHKHKHLYLILTSSLAVFTVMVSDKNFRWLAFNGLAATDLSERLLSNSNRELPNWAWGYVMQADPIEGGNSF